MREINMYLLKMHTVFVTLPPVLTLLLSHHLWIYSMRVRLQCVLRYLSPEENGRKNGKKMKMQCIIAWQEDGSTGKSHIMLN